MNSVNPVTQTHLKRRIKEKKFKKLVCTYKQYIVFYVRNLIIHTLKKSHTVHLDIGHLLVLTYFFRVEHGTISKVSYHQFYQEFTGNIEIIQDTDRKRPKTENK